MKHKRRSRIACALIFAATIALMASKNQPWEEDLDNPPDTVLRDGYYYQFVTVELTQVFSKRDLRGYLGQKVDIYFIFESKRVRITEETPLLCLADDSRRDGLNPKLLFAVKAGERLTLNMAKELNGTFQMEFPPWWRHYEFVQSEKWRKLPLMNRITK